MLTIPNTKLIFRMDKDNAPALTCAAGAQVRFETCDCFTDAIQSEQDLIMDIDFNRINPATGPVFVEGAQPGDVLKVTINRIEVNNQGVITVAKDFGLLGDRITEPATRLVDVTAGKASFLGVDIPMRKMIGVIGTAPANEGIETGTPGDHGGNMDCRLIREGAVLYLPVQVEGALFALGDLHIAMGDGEIGVSGVETAGTVDVTLDVLRDTELPTPFVDTGDVIATIVSADTMEKASYDATARMATYIMKQTGLSFADAVMLLTAAADLAVCQVVDPQVTMRMEISKQLVEAFASPNAK